MTDEVAAEIAKNCPDLEVLDLGWCGKLSGVGLLNIVSFCTKIQRLRLCESSAFNGHQTQELMLALRDLEDLQVLVLSGCRHLTDDLLRFYLRGHQLDPPPEERRNLPTPHSTTQPLQNSKSLRCNSS